ncbi:MAG: hypothetical protein MZV63_72500 [Marinilabiliales bacterium]|nr:hypothetical protein [Marinilabiliales bacterium]
MSPALQPLRRPDRRPRTSASSAASTACAARGRASARLPGSWRWPGSRAGGQPRPATLPGGWKQRLALGCAVLHEPARRLPRRADGRRRPDLAAALLGAHRRACRRAGVTVFVTTHYLDEAEYCNRHPRSSTPAGIVAARQPCRSSSAVFAGHAVLEVAADRGRRGPRDPRSRSPGSLETSIFGTPLHVGVADEAEGRRARPERLARARASRGDRVERIVPSLEDVFIHHDRGARRRGRRGSAP